MLITQQLFLTAYASVALGRFISVYEPKDHQENVVKKLKEIAVPMQMLHRSPELELRPLRKNLPVDQEKDDGATFLLTPDKALEGGIEFSALPIIHPDEQASDLYTDNDDNGKNDNEIPEQLISQVDFCAFLSKLKALLFGKNMRVCPKNSAPRPRKAAY
ncbi:unnamed protein product [Gongylonema pulchrum]|uniref:Uncharacterized protein n=1 Tax=Gongylonema pulchrum TaxID=637853 RepID=A0A183CVK1_9BILA|nr:unnamed protein product [Gongylonema pulchrum]